MARSLTVEALMKHLFPSFYIEFYSLPIQQNPKPHGSFAPEGELTKLLDLIVKGIWVQSHIIALKWFDFFYQHRKRLMSSPRNYVKYVMYACILVEGLTTNVYERFIAVCSLVTKVGIVTYQYFGKHFYKLTPEILKVFFDKILQKAFYRCGGWRLLNQYLSKQKYLKFFDKFKGKKSLRTNLKSQKKLAEKVGQVTRLPKYETGKIIPKAVKNEKYTKYLTSKVMSAADASLLEELSHPTSPEKQHVSSTAKSSSTESTVSESTSEVSIICDESKVDVKIPQAILSSEKNTKFNLKEKSSEESSHKSLNDSLSKSHYLGKYNAALERLKHNFEDLVVIFDTLSLE